MDKLELTPEYIRELKQYVFAMYIGQNVLRYNVNSNKTFEVKYSSLKYPNILGVNLQLRPLSAISHSEYENLKDLYFPSLDAKKTVFMEVVENLLSDGDLMFTCYQYLSQIGIALPIYYKGQTITVPHLEAAGIIKFKG